MKLRSKVEKLLNSGVTSYRIQKLSGVAQPNIDKVRKGERSIGKMEFRSVEKLGAVYDDLMAEVAAGEDGEGIMTMKKRFKIQAKKIRQENEDGTGVSDVEVVSSMEVMLKFLDEADIVTGSDKTIIKNEKGVEGVGVTEDSLKYALKFAIGTGENHFEPLSKSKQKLVTFRRVSEDYDEFVIDVLVEDAPLIFHRTY